MAARHRKKATKKAAGRQRPAKKGTSRQQTGGDPKPGGDLIDMPEAIRLLKTTRPTFYRWLRAGKIKGMKVGRQWRFYREDVERFLKGQEPRIDLPADITPLLKTLHQLIAEAGGPEVPGKGRGPVRQTVHLMAALGMAMQASDIHLTSHVAEGVPESVTTLRYRVDGVLRHVTDVDRRLLPAIIDEMKRMASLDVHEKERSQDGRIAIPADELGGTAADLRVNFLPTALGESATIRLLVAETEFLQLWQLGFSKEDEAKLRQAIGMPWGVTVVTGPTGCGKTTTLYACMDVLAKPECKIMTIEDPVEYLMPWVTQARITPTFGYRDAMVAMMRSAPNVMMVSEIRDAETAAFIQNAALTGHLLLTAMHAHEAAKALRRFLDLECSPFVTADAVKLVVAQTLVRRVCPTCSVLAEPDADQLAWAKARATSGGLDWDSLGRVFRKAVGCADCQQSGYRTRTLIAEMLEVTPRIGQALRDNASEEQLQAIAVEEGMTTLAADGIRRAALGQTTLDEVMRVVR